MKELVLINRKGREEFRLPAELYRGMPTFWHDGRLWGFGVGKLNGEQHYYEILPLETPPQGKPHNP